MVANQNAVPVLCKGNVKITTKVGKSTYQILVRDVFYVPDIATNLLSVGLLIKNRNQVYFIGHGCNIFNSNHKLVGTAKLCNNMYKVNIETMDMYQFAWFYLA